MIYGNKNMNEIQKEDCKYKHVFASSIFEKQPKTSRRYSII